MDPTKPAEAAGTTTTSAPDDVWRLMGGRGTIAGRFLHRLYAGGATLIARQAGDAYSARNRVVSAGKRVGASGPGVAGAGATTGAAATTTTTTTKAPKPRLPRSGTCDPAAAAATALAQEALAAQRRLASLGPRRSAAAIEAAAALALPPAAPRPRRPMLGEAEKARCALLMEHRGVIPAVDAASSPQKPARRRRFDDDEEDDDGHEDDAAARRFAELEEEVSDRERFLEAMKSAGALRREHVEVVRAQVADRAAEMRRLHAQLVSAAAGVAG